MSLNDLSLNEMTAEEMQATDGGALPALLGLAVLLYATDAW